MLQKARAINNILLEQGNRLIDISLFQAVPVGKGKPHNALVVQPSKRAFLIRGANPVVELAIPVGIINCHANLLGVQRPPVFPILAFMNHSKGFA